MCKLNISGGGITVDNKIRILVVDNEPRICHSIVAVLVPDRYMVDVSFSGTDAMQMIKQNDYHLLITDIDVPGIDGLELIQKLKKQNPDAEAIIITGNTIVDVATWSLIYGIDNHLKKPFDIIKLGEMVKQTLCDHKMLLDKM